MWECDRRDENINYARRCLGCRSFGQGFDSPHLHHKQNGSTVMVEPFVFVLKSKYGVMFLVFGTFYNTHSKYLENTILYRKRRKVLQLNREESAEASLGELIPYREK